MAARVAAFDWSATALGAPESWSPTLQMMVRMVLANAHPIILWWGPQYIQIYNDPYRPILGTKDPRALGQPARECWTEIWDVIGPLIDVPFGGGPPTWNEDIHVEIVRYGFPDEGHFTIAYSPVPDETAPGGVGGVLANVHEITEQVLGKRRVVVLRDLGACANESAGAAEACSVAAGTLAAHDKDLPFVLIYLISADGKRASLEGAAGIEPGTPMAPSTVDLLDGDNGPWPIARALRTENVQVVESLGTRFADVPRGPWSDPPGKAVVVAVPSNKPHASAAVMVVGISARLRFDDAYRDFLGLMTTQIATVIANARAYEEERRRADALAEIDRAKTAFFSNVSHEFRTPLTLMLGPIEDALADADLPAAGREHLAVAHRNSLRLLKLVNAMLDFSRIEAGRAQATYEAVDLATFTAELASNFRSACERAGLSLSIDCPALPRPVCVDRGMWEKIVLNLLSNAFKFTFDGGIAVRLRAHDDRAELTVRDSGVGVSETELPRLFERFHRIEGQRSRTHEGSGIGLALVQELVKLHGGAIRAESAPGQGTTFTITIPLGTTHLAAERIEASSASTTVSLRADAFVEEALRWLPDADAAGSIAGYGDAPSGALGPHAGARVLVADDNADMRTYLQRLLAPHCRVQTVADGAAALESIRAQRPDLVLADVMMPGLDGFALLHAIRADAQCRDAPVILLSARAGEEARVEGLAAGANDYLVKPFSARELIARVDGNLKLATARRDTLQVLREGAARQAFLLRLSDALRAEPNADAVAHLAVRLLAFELDVDRCCVASIHLDEDRADFTHRFSRQGAPTLPASIRPSDFPTALQQIIAQTLVVNDAVNQPELDDHERRSLAAIEFGAYIVGAVRHGEGNPAWAMVPVSKQPREWTVAEVTLVEAAAERAWAAVERVRAQNALLASEQKYRALFETMDEGFCIIEKSDSAPGAPADFRWVEGNPAFWNLAQHGDLLGKSVRQTFRDEAGRAIEVYDRVLASGEPMRFEYAMPSLGSILDLHAFRPGGEGSRKVAVIVRDITVHKQAERAKARLASIVDSSDDAIISKGLDGIVQTWNVAAQRMFGYTAAEAIGRSIAELIIPDDRQAEETDILRRLASGESIDHFETVRRRQDGAMLDTSVTISPLYAHGRIIGASKIAHDISVRKRAAERQQVMIAELQHRTRNLIGVVRAIAAQTLQTSPSLAHFGDQFDGRLRALAGVQALLSRSDEEPITVGALVQMELNALGAIAAGDRVHVEGPPVRIRNSIAQTLALAIHELATNARKYGALASERAQLRIRWHVLDEGGESQLRIDWEERGIEAGAVMPTPGGGYGRKLIEKALPYALDARTSFELGDGELHCCIKLPLNTG